MSFSRLDHLFSSVIFILYLVLLAALPLLFSMNSSEVFEFPKMLFVYAMTVLIVACWIGRMIVNRRIIYVRTSLDIPLYLYLFSQILSTFFSIDPHTSIHGYYSRWNGGLLSTIAYTLLYAAFVSNSAEKGLALPQGQAFRNAALPRYSVIRLLGYSVLPSATLVAAYALLQRLGIDKHLWVQDVVTRVFSTQGQPNWLAAYLVMVIPLAWATGMSNEQETRNNEKNAKKLSRQFIAHCFLLIVFLLAIAFTRSRSGLLGLAVADVVFWGVLFLKRSDLGILQGRTFSSFRFRRLFLIFHCFLLIVFLSTNNPARNALRSMADGPAREWVQKRLQTTDDGRRSSESSSLSPNPYPLIPNLSSDITPSSDIRRIVWHGALQLVKQRPIFGWGPETFAYTYWRVRPIEHNATSEWNFLYNKAHNEWLNLAANTGLLGLGSHLLLLGWFTIWALRQLKSPFTPCSLLLAPTISALWGAEIVNFFGFSTVTTQAYSYIFMGIAVASTENRKQKTENNQAAAESKRSISFIAYCFLLTVFSLALYLLYHISLSYLADLSYNRGKQLAKAGYVREALPALDAAVSLAPGEPVFRSELAETQGVLALSLAASSSADAAGIPDAPDLPNQIFSLKDSSLDNFSIVATQNPANVSFLRTRARMTYALGSFDPPLYDQGLELMKRAMELAPTDPKIPYNLGVMLLDRGRENEARAFFEKALKLKPDYEEVLQVLKGLN